MSILSAPPKLRDTHLQRQALIYIRQSTLIQVRDHTGSTARQYHLADRARELGWPEDRILVIDQDQGRSGASSVGREGFEQLVTEVSLGRAGPFSAWKPRGWPAPVVIGIGCWKSARSLTPW